MNQGGGSLQERKKTTAVHSGRTRGQSDLLRSQGTHNNNHDDGRGGFSAHGGGWPDSQSEQQQPETMDPWDPWGWAEMAVRSVRPLSRSRHCD
jgi:hypothetical protein